MSERPTIVGVMDVVSKFALGAVGLLATLYFQQSEVRRGQQDAARNFERLQAEEQARLEESFAKHFSAVAAADPKTAGPEQDVALIIAANAATRLSEKHNQPSFIALLQSRVDSRQSAVINNVAFQAKEAIAAEQSDASKSASVGSASEDPAASRYDSAPSAAGGDSWFAVAGSFSLDNESGARIFAQELDLKLKAAGINRPVGLWRTVISQNFAVCVGGELTQAEASLLADQLRDAKMVSDAFAQRNRDWEPVTE